MLFNFEDQTADLTIPKPYKDLGFNLSGGADSALLLYLLVKQIRHNNLDVNIHVITGSYAFRGYSTQRASNRVLEFILDKFQAHDVIKTNYQFYKDLRRDDDFHQIWDDWWRSKRIDLMVNAITSMPKDLDATVVNARGIEVKLYEDPDAPTSRFAFDNNLTLQFKAQPYKSDAAWHPLINVDKKFVHHLYTEFKLLEDLYPLTYSCESRTPDNCNNFTIHCNDCWWCLERKWAFG